MSVQTTETLLYEAALKYELRGWSVLPLQPSGKKPLLASWKQYQQTRATDDEIGTWFLETPSANVGIITGQVSGLIVLDLDNREQAVEEIKRRGMPSTPTVETASGYHIYLRHPGGNVRNFAKKLPGMDLRGDGGYVVAPPSIHPTGKPYRWVLSPDEAELADPPAWLLELVAETKPHVREMPTAAIRGKDYATTALASEANNVRFSPESQHKRNHTLNIAAMKLGQLIASGHLDRSQVESVLRSAALDSGLTENETEKTIASGIKKGLTEPRQLPESARRAPGAAETLPQSNGSDTDYSTAINRTDLGNARLMVEQHGEQIRWLAEQSKWLLWDGSRWNSDKLLQIERIAKYTVASIYNQAAEQTENDDLRKALVKWGYTSESRGKIEAMIKHARSEPGITISSEILDRDQYLLNCTNGTLDLRTGALGPHQRDDLITKRIEVDYDSAAVCPTWERFLYEVMDGNEDLVSFLQRAVGYTLTGNTEEQCLFFMYGSGRNGKTTFMETISTLLADYSVRVKTKALMSTSDGNGATPDIAQMPGARLAVASETEEGRKLDETLIKDLTGMDTITARPLYSAPFSFKATHKLWIHGNHKPTIKGQDEGIWRRIKLIPFTVKITAEQRDPQMLIKLNAELPGILAWGVRGCLTWLHEGLNPPAEVQAATESYRAEMDILQAWQDDCCVLVAAAQTSSADLYASYKAWCEINSEKPLTLRAWGLKMTERGEATRQRGNRGQNYLGIGLRSEKD